MQVRTRWHMVATAVLVLATVGCPSGDDTATQQQPPVDQRARDSAVAESGLPGASGIRRALDVADSAEARQARMDSIGREP